MLAVVSCIRIVFLCDRWLWWGSVVLILRIRIVWYWHYLPCSLYQTCLVHDIRWLHRKWWGPCSCQGQGLGSRAWAQLADSAVRIVHYCPCWVDGPLGGCCLEVSGRLLYPVASQPCLLQPSVGSGARWLLLCLKILRPWWVRLVQQNPVGWSQVDTIVLGPSLRVTRTIVSWMKERSVKERRRWWGKLNKSVELLDAQAELAGESVERKDGWHHSHSCKDNILFLLVPLT